MDGIAGGNLQLTALLGRFLDMGKSRMQTEPDPPGRPVPPTWWLVKVGKLEGPVMLLVFLGTLLDTQTRLPEDKLEIRSKWLSWRSGKKRELLSLIGKLSHVAKILVPGSIACWTPPTRPSILTTGCTLTTTLSQTCTPS